MEDQKKDIEDDGKKTDCSKVVHQAGKTWEEMVGVLLSMKNNGWWIGVKGEEGGWKDCRLCDRTGVVMPDEEFLNGEVVEFMKEWKLVDWVMGEATKSGPGRVIVEGRKMLFLTDDGIKLLGMLADEKR